MGYNVRGQKGNSPALRIRSLNYTLVQDSYESTTAER